MAVEGSPPPTCHMSYVNIFFNLFSFQDKGMKLISEGLLSTGPTWSSSYMWALIQAKYPLSVYLFIVLYKNFF